jgi:hypothetical protein
MISGGPTPPRNNSIVFMAFWFKSNFKIRVKKDRIKRNPWQAVMAINPSPDYSVINVPSANKTLHLSQPNLRIQGRCILKNLET